MSETESTYAYKVTDAGIEHTLAEFKVTNNLTNTLPAATNVKEKSNPEKIITASETSKVYIKVKGKKCWFVGSLITAETKEDAQSDYWTTETNSSDATVVTNNNIRSLPKKDSTTTIDVIANANMVVLAVPSNKTLTKVTSRNQFGSEITGNFTANMKTLNVGGADSIPPTGTNPSIGSCASEYKVYIYYIDSPDTAADVYTITVS